MKFRVCVDELRLSSKLLSPIDGSWMQDGSDVLMGVEPILQ